MKQKPEQYLAALVVASVGLWTAGSAGATNLPSATAGASGASESVSVSSSDPGSRTSPHGHSGSRAAKGRAARAVGASTKARNPLAVDPDIAVKDTPVKEIDLPGVMKIPGQSLDVLDPTRAHRIPMTDGGVTTVYMSINAPNRIELPFRNPYIVHRDDLQVDHRGITQNLYVYWKALPASEETMFIEPPGGGPVLGLDLVPKDIPAQTFIVTDDTGIVAGHQKPARSGDDYISHVQDVMEAVALGHAPDGYSSVDITLPPIAMNGLTVTADKRYSSREGDIYVYTARNLAQSRAMVTEQEFDGANVLAVSIFPKPVLLPGENTQILVFSRKNEDN